MVNRKFVCKPVNFAKVRKGRAIPKQSMDLKEIVRRFIKRIPVEVSTQEPVYLDGYGDADMEKVDRLSTVDRAFHATEVAERTAILKKEADAKTDELVKENERIRLEKEEQERSEREPGIDLLDNTMPDDTMSDNQQIRRVSKKRK